MLRRANSPPAPQRLSPRDRSRASKRLNRPAQEGACHRGEREGGDGGKAGAGSGKGGGAGEEAEGAGCREAESELLEFEMDSVSRGHFSCFLFWAHAPRRARGGARRPHLKTAAVG
jgi:hypothetical protein